MIKVKAHYPFFTQKDFSHRIGYILKRCYNIFSIIMIRADV